MTAETDVVWKIFPVIYIVAGIFFNFYQLMAFVVKKFRKENVFIYFVFLMIADILVLTTSLLSRWFKYTVIMDIRSMTAGGCRFHIWLAGVVMDIPPWILVIMTYEKRAFLWYPVPADSQFTKTVARLVIFGVVFLNAIRRVHVLWGSIYYEALVTFSNGSDANVSLSREGRVKLVVCGVTNNRYGFFMAMYNPWIDMVLRVISPFACLAAYNTLVLRKLHREKYCANRLLKKVGILPPSWFYAGVMEAEYTMVRSVILTVFMLIANLPYSFYVVLQTRAFGTNVQYRPVYWLMSNMLYYLNYCYLYPAFAVYDHHLLVTMRDTWRSPLARKRGSSVASMPPRITPMGSSHSSSSVSNLRQGNAVSHNYRSQRKDSVTYLVL